MYILERTPIERNCLFFFSAESTTNVQNIPIHPRLEDEFTNRWNDVIPQVWIIVPQTICAYF